MSNSFLNWSGRADIEDASQNVAVPKIGMSR